MAADIVPETGEMLRVAGQVWDSGIHHAAGVACELGKARRLSPLAARINHEAQSLFDEILELATFQCCLRLGATIELLRNLDGGLHLLIHKTIFTGRR